MAAKAIVQKPGFKLGTKQIYLPQHVITLMRREKVPPNEACFRVPLRFTKFDLRDYLWNLYGVEAKTVRSHVAQQPLERRSRTSPSVYRPMSIKYMTVVLVKPFQWPDPPSDLEPWHNEMWQKREEAQKKMRREAEEARGWKKWSLISKQPWSESRKELASLAKRMLAGKEEWKNGVDLDPRWDKLLAKDKKVAAAAAATSITTTTTTTTTSLEDDDTSKEKVPQ
ncbi:hypothetical protein CP533_2113 [Ophiocordyceps camponoti-saundersi (nom. inval.)]|nr:hypothetical protein CP533_2113 [Ophiocordyceps camponoti-saundersi (nom. inval.)]